MGKHQQFLARQRHTVHTGVVYCMYQHAKIAAVVEDLLNDV